MGIPVTSLIISAMGVAYRVGCVRMNSSVGRESLYFTTELHTSSVRVRVQPGSKYLYGKKIRWECMWFGCRLPVAMVSQAYPGNAEICPGFSPPQAALRIILSYESDAVYIYIHIHRHRRFRDNSAHSKLGT